MNCISVKWANDSLSEKVEIHKLPCSIEYSGSARISELFCQTKDLSSSFRGHELLGIESNVPDGYKGVMLKKSDTTTDKENQDLSAVRLFDSMKVWGWDVRPPPLNFDKMIAIQKALHDPI